MTYMDNEKEGAMIFNFNKSVQTSSDNFLSTIPVFSACFFEQFLISYRSLFRLKFFSVKQCVSILLEFLKVAQSFHLGAVPREIHLLNHQLLLTDSIPLYYHFLSRRTSHPTSLSHLQYVSP